VRLQRVALHGHAIGRRGVLAVLALLRAGAQPGEVHLERGRVATPHGRASTAYQIREEIRWPPF
jgi:hypothetical protein